MSVSKALANFKFIEIYYFLGSLSQYEKKKQYCAQYCDKYSHLKDWVLNVPTMHQKKEWITFLSVRQKGMYVFAQDLDLYVKRKMRWQLAWRFLQFLTKSIKDNTLVSSSKFMCSKFSINMIKQILKIKQWKIISFYIYKFEIHTFVYVWPIEMRTYNLCT